MRQKPQNIFEIDVTIPEKILEKKDTKELYKFVSESVVREKPEVKFNYVFSFKFKLDSKEENFDAMKEQLKTFVNFTN